jgi:hypothetical protein
VLNHYTIGPQKAANFPLQIYIKAIVLVFVIPNQSELRVVNNKKLCMVYTIASPFTCKLNAGFSALYHC